MYYANRLARRLSRTALRSAILAGMAIGIGGSSVMGQTAESPATSGRVTLELPDLPPATVELDLGRGLIRNALGLGDAAIAGFIEGLTTSPNAQSTENAKFIAQQLTSARELGDAASEVIHEVHLRVWDDLPEGSQLAEQVIDQLDARLGGNHWEPALRVRDGDDTVRVFVHRTEDSLSGALIVAGSGDELVLANVIGDLSPEKVQQLTSTATKIGVELGLDKEINRAVDRMRREMEHPR